MMPAIVLSLLMVFCSAQADTFTHLRSVYWQREISVQTADNAARLTQSIGTDTRRWLNEGARLNISHLQRKDATAVFEQEWQLTLPALFTSDDLQTRNKADAERAQAALQWAHINASAHLYRLLGDNQIDNKIRAIWQQRHDTTTALLRDIERRVSAGESAAIELTQMRLELSTTQNESLQADLRYQEGQLQLQEMLGQIIDVERVTLPQEGNADDIHPLLKMAALEQQRARADHDWSRAWSRDIEWSLIYKQQRDEPAGERESMNGIGISVPLGSNATRRQEQLASQLALQQTQTVWQWLQQNLPLQQQRAALRRDSARQRVEQLQSAQQWLQQQLEAIDRAWRQGEIDFNERLRADQRQTQGQLDYWQAQKDHINAQADWFVAFGVLP